MTPASAVAEASDSVSALRIVTEALGGGPLARAGLAGAVPPGWYVPPPVTPEAWRQRATEVKSSIDSGWLDRLWPAMEPSGPAAERLTRVARCSGVVVTSGQQPGLFGGPIYTWSKAMTIRALADALEAATGVPVAAVFWAATDDSDFAEASWTSVGVRGGYERLEVEAPGDADLMSMSAMPLPDVAPALRALERACGSGTDQRALAALRRSYVPGATMGSAYVSLLREILHPLGVAVLDASHACVRSTARPILLRALRNAPELSSALAQRTREIRGAGLEPQVVDVEDRSLVFSSAAGRRTRIAIAGAEKIASSDAILSPNVLLRPIVERAILPTAAYAAGPGEFAYFAQVSAVADEIGAPRPLAVPRWSVTLVEPQIDTLLDAYRLSIADVASPDALSKRLLQQAMPKGISEQLAAMESALRRHTDALRLAVRAEGDLMPERSVDAIEHVARLRLERFQRRVRAAVRRRDTALAADIGSLSGALFPGGVRQERMLNVIPFLVKYGCSVLDRMADEAGKHARALVGSSQ
ncbi:MAG: putative cysteine ligase BshC [Gemmatimonadaceae bacterium]|nr:putative cysteine ligase BshC [Gemmatimonadaceae bacterium]